LFSELSGFVPDARVDIFLNHMSPVRQVVGAKHLKGLMNELNRRQLLLKVAAVQFDER
jgi:hypothetical protein